MKCEYPKKPASRCPYMAFMREDELVRSQNDDSFCLQYSHSPHAIWNDATTRSPTWMLVTFGPTLSTIPMNSATFQSVAVV